MLGLELRQRCLERAQVYSLAVQVFGGTYYDAAQLQACECCEARWSGTLSWTTYGKQHIAQSTAGTAYSEDLLRVGSGRVTFSAAPAEISSLGGAFVVDSFAADDRYTRETVLANATDVCTEWTQTSEVNSGTADGGAVPDKSALLVVDGRSYSILFPPFGIETFRTSTTENLEQCPSDTQRRLVSTTTYKGKSDLGVVFRTEGRSFTVDATNPRRFNGSASTVNTDPPLAFETKFEWDFFQPQ